MLIHGLTFRFPFLPPTSFSAFRFIFPFFSWSSLLHSSCRLYIERPIGIWIGVDMDWFKSEVVRG